MMGMSRIRFAVALAIIFFVRSLLISDMSSAIIDPGGGGFSPKAPNHNMRMDSQEVLIRLKKTSYVVDAIFHFFNTGESTTEWIGFPIPRNHLTRFTQLDSLIDGRRLDLVKKSRVWAINLPYLDYPNKKRQWLGANVVFQGHAVTKIRLNYETSYLPFRSNAVLYFVRNVRKTPGRVVYEYGTCSYWKDRIGILAFTIDGSELGGRKHFTSHFRSYLVGLAPNMPPPEKRPKNPPKPDGENTRWQKLETKNAVRFIARNVEPKLADYLAVYLIR
jgi:hypothetical protein